MNRWAWFVACIILGLVMVYCGLLMPAHLRAVESDVLNRAGRGTPSLIDHGEGLVMAEGLGAAGLISQAARMEKIPGHAKLDLVVRKLAPEHPDWFAWGGGDAYLEGIYKSGPVSTNLNTRPFIELAIRPANQRKALEQLRASTLPGVQQLLACRSLTNTVIFPPSQSASGQAFDASLATCGLLLAEFHLTPGLSNAIVTAAADATRGQSPLPLEQVLLDLMSLGQRFNWGQIAVFVMKIPDPETLRLLAEDLRESGAQSPVIFSAVQLSGNPAGVARYLANFSATGLKDLGSSLRFGTGGVNELLRRNQRLADSSLARSIAGHGSAGALYDRAVDFCLRSPRAALAVKWIFYLAGGFFIALALHFARPEVSSLELPLHVRGFHVAREILFALGFLLVVLLLSEPFLAQESQKAESHFRPLLPMVGNAVPMGMAGVKTSFMNQPTLSLMTLLVFFVLQGLLYISCLVKLAEIRRQKLRPGIKLKLLENEEHLFDAGLYLGFAGTIVSLIFVSLGVIKFSLMAAYSSTSFGIIFVSIFKIFHLRPLRRKLLLEADASAHETPAHLTVHAAPVTPS